MNDKPHFYKKYGYWNCMCGGFHGAAYSIRGAAESMLKLRRFWMQNIGRSNKDLDLT